MLASDVVGRRVFLAPRPRRSNNLPARSCARTSTRGPAMRNSTVIALFSCLLAATSASADQPLDCSKKSLAAAIADRQGRAPVVEFTGVCAGPIVIKAEGVTLQGVGEAVIDGGGAQDAVTIAGASRVTLNGIEIRNGV